MSAEKAKMADSASDNSPVLYPSLPPPPPPPGGGTGADVGSCNKCGRLVLLLDFGLRLLSILTTFIATVVMGVNRQKGVQAMDSSQLRYFVPVNATASAYASASLALPILNRRRSPSSPSRKILTLLIAILDVVMVAFLFSGVGSASAISVSFRDSPMFCDSFGKFCTNMGAAIAMSTLGAAAFLGLTVLATVGLHTRSMWGKDSSSAMASTFVSPANHSSSVVALDDRYTVGTNTSVSPTNHSSSVVALDDPYTVAANTSRNHSAFPSTTVSPSVALGMHSPMWRASY